MVLYKLILKIFLFIILSSIQKCFLLRKSLYVKIYRKMSQRSLEKQQDLSLSKRSKRRIKDAISEQSFIECKRVH